MYVLTSSRLCHLFIPALRLQMKAATDRSFTAAAAALSLLAATLHAAGLASAAFHTGDVAIIQQTQMNLTDLDCNVKSVALVVSPPPQCSAPACVQWLQSIRHVACTGNCILWIASEDRLAGEKKLAAVGQAQAPRICCCQEHEICNVDTASPWLLSML